MTKEEAIKILSILKAAYPNSYKGITKDEANGIIGIWAVQFIDIPYDIVSIAVQKAISTNTFPPTISEVKEKIHNLYGEAWELKFWHEQSKIGVKLNDDDPNEEPVYMGKRLDEKTFAVVERILQICEHYKTKEKIEPTLCDLIGGMNNYLGSNSDIKKLNV